MFNVTVSNPTGKVATVLGVQTSPGLYISSFPQTIPANGSSAFGLVYYSQPGTSATTDLMRVMTDQGQITVQVDHSRAQVVTFNSTALRWSVGEGSTPKSVTMTVSSGTSTPTSVTALGKGNSAQLLSEGGGTYQIVVTPASTEKPESFSVIVQFNPGLPDVVPIVTCTVGSN